MVELRLVGLSEDRRRLILRSAAGQEFSVAVDDRLRAALRGDRARLGQLEIQMDSALRPRDIQARIRAGQSPESVAEVAQCSVDKILGYAVPVLAERRHLAERAQRSAIRRTGGDGPGRLLGDAVEERLRLHHVDPETAEWDAWRREDGKWTVTVSHRAPTAAAPGPGTASTPGSGSISEATTGQQTATFTFDALGRYVVAEDDPARWLLGEAPVHQPGEPPAQAVSSAQAAQPVRRLTAVRERDDGPSLFEHDDLAAVADAVGREQETVQSSADDPPGDRGSTDDDSTDDDSPDDDSADAQPAGAEEEPAHASLAEPASEVAAAAGSSPREEPKRRGRKSRGRASVPSWDEIMFGRTRD